MGRMAAARVTRLLAAIVVCLTLLGYASPVSAAPVDLCSQQLQALLRFKADVAAHNARPHTFQMPRQAAALAEYNQEAARLTARKAVVTGNVRICLEAMQKLAETNRSTLALEPPSREVRTAIDNARKAIPPGWKPPAPPAQGKNWMVPKGSVLRPLYDELRKGNPGLVKDVTFQGRPRPAVTDPDPAYPGRTIGMSKNGTITDQEPHPDHIIPIAEIVNMPNFLRLKPEYMYLVTRAPVNYQWLGARSNLSKKSRSVEALDDVDPRWRNEQVALEKRVRADLTDIINQLLKLQG